MIHETPFDHLSLPPLDFCVDVPWWAVGIFGCLLLGACTW